MQTKLPRLTDNLNSTYLVLTPAALWIFWASWLSFPGDDADPNLGGVSLAGFSVEVAPEQVVAALAPEQVVAALAQAEVDA